MDYEKKYIEALERAKDYHKQLIEEDNSEWAGEIENIFPELRESEDDRISREITEFILTHRIDEPNDIEDTNRWLAWLEKQGDKLTDTVESKFHEGDWIVNNNSEGVCQVTEIKDDEYCLWPLDAEILGYLRIIDVDNDYHLWTIKDAKDGDVLAFDNETIVIFKDLYNYTTFHSYCHIEDNVFRVTEDGMPDWWEGKEFHPATKEQRDLLFKKMRETGYEWDAEKKEIRKIKKQSKKKYSWSKKDNKMFYYALDMIEWYNGKNENKARLVSDWLKSLKQRIEEQ